MSNPYIDRKQRIGEGGRRTEKRVAQRYGATLVAASGATRGKGDMELGQFLIESKSTINGSMGVKYQWLAKIENEALAVGKTPALVISFVRPSGADLPAGRWVLVPERTFQEFVSSDPE